MRKIVEYTLASVDGVTDPARLGFMDDQDDAYLRDGLGQLMACDAMLFGRATYEIFAKAWPGRDHPWAARLNSIRKYVFSSTLEQADWANSTIVRGDVVTEATKLKEQDGGDLLIYGRGQLAQTLLAAQLTDVLGVSVHPVLAGPGQLLGRAGQQVKLKLVETRTFSRIVKLSYEPQYA
jgi:dihydrofolate reductase